jgi:riboflavin kinase / FMN adenylyltransferase
VSESVSAVYHDLHSVPPGQRVVTIGNFDGVHRGHQYLIRRVVDDAQKRGMRSLVITFEPHPTSVLRQDVPFQRLTSAGDKLRLLDNCGADEIVVLPFTVDFASQEPEEFLSALTTHVSPAAIFVGEGFRFGRNRAGDGETIRSFGAAGNFETTVISRLRENGGVISSSTIRNALARGDIEAANDWLGRRYHLRGRVEHGEARGRELGFPTANLQLDGLACLPSDGIYAAYACLDDPTSAPRPSMVYVGTRPTFDGQDRVVEANLLDFSGDLYTRDLTVEFVRFIRADAQFETADALSSQMRRDEIDTRSALVQHPPSAST